MDLAQYVYIFCQTFMSYLHNILKTYFSVVLSFCFCVVILLLLHIFVCCKFMMYPTSYCCHYKLTNPWNVCT